MKKRKYQLAGQNPCGEGTQWDANTMQCVPIPTNPNAPQSYTQNYSGNATNFVQSAYTNGDGKVINGQTMPLNKLPNGQFAFDPTAGATDARGNFVPYNKVIGGAIDSGFNLDSDGVYRKKQITTNNNILGYSDGFKLLNTGLGLTQGIAGVVNDEKTKEREKYNLLKARYSQAQYNPYEQGLNQVGVYQNGGSIQLNPAHKGLFIKEAKQAGMSVQQFASHVLANKDRYSPDVVKRAVFAHNFAHQNGGYINNTGYTPGTPTYNNPVNIIPSEEITMQHTPFPVMAYPQNGQPTLMQPGNNYTFKGSKYVTEVPVKQNGGILAQQECPTGDCTDGYAYNKPHINLIPNFLKGDPNKKALRQEAKYNSDPAMWLNDRANFYKNNLDFGKYPVTSFDPQPSQNGVYYGVGNNIIFNNELAPVPTMVQNVAQNGGDMQQPKLNDKQLAAAMLNSGKQLTAKQKQHFQYVLEGRIPMDGHVKDAKPKGTYQNGGVPEVQGAVDGNSELEKGEVFQSNQGGIQKVAESEPTHEDGGSIQPNVQRVLEDTADKRKDTDSKLLRITPEQAYAVTGFKPKGTVTHSKLYEQATQYYDKKQKQIENTIKTNLDYVKQNGGQFAKNSLDQNLQLLQTLPTKAQLFDAIFNHQEQVKQTYGIDNNADQQQQKYGGKAKFTIGGINDDDEPVDPYKGGKTKKGKTTPTGLDNTFAFNGGLPAYQALWKKAGLDLDSFKTNADAQSAVYDYLLQNNPDAIRDMWKTYGNTAAGIKAGLPATFTDSYLNNPQNLEKLKQGYVDNLLGVRTLAPKLMPEITVTGNTTDNRPPVTTQYDTPNAQLENKFNYPLHWYDTAGNLDAYLSASERIPVSFEQLQRQPLQAHELNPQPTLDANQGDFNAALKTLPTNGVGYANTANLLGNKYKVNNEVLGTYADKNQQIHDRVDEINNANQYQLDLTNLNLRDHAVQQQLQAMDNERNQKFVAFNDYLTKLAQNNQFNLNGNLALQLTPYFNQQGQFNGNKYILQTAGNGAVNLFDKQTGKYIQTVYRDQNGQLKSTKQTTVATVK